MGKNKGKRVLENNKDKKSNKKGLKIFLVILLIIILAGITAIAYRIHQNGGGLQGILATAMGHDELTKKDLPEFRVLLLGISRDLDIELTDTIIVASYNPNTQKATLLSIPRDTYIGKNKKKATGSNKINAMYTIKGGPEGTLEAVNEITGLDIQYYAVVETNALIKLVDAIGGVNYNVPIDMDYDDPTQDLHIHLTAGEQLIDGEKAEYLLRFRHNNDGTSYPTEYGDNDIGRMRTQREFLSETMRQTLKIENVFKLGEILDIAKESIRTNIDFNVAKDYIPYLVEFKTENLVSDTVPGVPSMLNELWFYEYDEEETKELVNKLFHERDYGDNEEVVDSTNTTVGNIATNTTVGEEKTQEDIKIQIVNGTGSEEKFEQAFQRLQEKGYDVTKSKEDATQSSRTVITNQKHVETKFVDEIKTILGIGDISNNGASTSKSDISIIIGTDYQ